MLEIYLSMYCSDLVEGVMPKWENKMPTSKDGFEPSYSEPQIPLTAAGKKTNPSVSQSRSFLLQGSINWIVDHI